MKVGLARTAVLLLVASSGIPVGAQTPYLVKDIDPAAGPGRLGTPRTHTPTSTALFTLADTPTGRGLVRIDSNGTPALVRQLAPATNEPARAMTAAGERLFFTAQGGLWTSDGTTAGTTMVKQFVHPSVIFAEGASGEMASVGDIVYFHVGGAGATGLWKSDGTPGGTVHVATISARHLTPTSDRLFFVGPGDGLWTTDGTEAGTVRLGSVVVKDVGSKMVPHGSGVLFVGTTTTTGGGDLWRSDGTQAGTVKVKTFDPSLPHSLTRLGGVVLLGAGTPEGIWRTDGTEAGTTLVKDGVTVRNMHEANGIVLLHGRAPATGRELWRTDGTTAGTTVLDYCTGPCSFLNFGNTRFATLPGGVVFSRLGSADLWRTDGTAAGIVPLVQFVNCGKNSDLDDLTSFASTVYFAACNAGPEVMWRTDGTVAGTVAVAMGTDGASSSPAFAGSAAAKAIFAAARPDVGREIWSTEGTEASTQLLADLTAGAGGTEWWGVASLGELFAFTTPPQLGAGPLWSTDGSPAGTREIAAIATDYTRRAPVRDGLALFGEGGVGGFSHPFRTDGTPEGTFAVARPAGPGALTGLALGKDPIAVYGSGFAMTIGDSTQSRGEVWLTVDGREEATRFSLGVMCAWVTAVEERLFLACPRDNTVNDLDLWISDGTFSGTHLLADLPGDALPGWAGLDGKLFFSVAGAAGASLWSSDGTAAGTAPLSSIATVPSEPRALTVSGGVLFFAGFTFETGYELWRTDGTAAGTYLLRDLDPGPASGLAPTFESDSAIAAASGGVVFTATTGTRGAELWWSDGTQAGTVPLVEVAPGPASSSASGLRRAGSRVYFAADDGVRGREPWAIELLDAVSFGWRRHRDRGGHGNGHGLLRGPPGPALGDPGHRVLHDRRRQRGGGRRLRAGLGHAHVRARRARPVRERDRHGRRARRERRVLRATAHIRRGRRGRGRARRRRDPGRRPADGLRG